MAKVLAVGISRHLVDITPLRRFPQYRRLWVGYAFRQLGAQLTVTTVIYQVFAITHSNLDVGYISLAQLVPAVLAPMAGGALADALDRRKLLLLMAVVSSFCTVGLAFNAMGRPSLWPMYVLSGAIAGFNGVDGPTRTAVQMTLVGKESFVAANVLRQMLSRISSVAGPSIAGILIAVFAHHIAWVYWLDVLSTLAALQAVIRLDPLPPEGGGRKFGISSIVEGFSFLRGRRIIQACFYSDLNATVLGLPTSLFPYMAFVHFHGGARTYGLLMAAPGAGALVGSVVSGWTSRVRRQGRAVLVSVMIWGLALAGFGVVPSLAVAAVLLAIAGWADLISATFRNTIVQIETPDRLRGRLSALNQSVVQAGPRLGNLEAGVVASISSAPISIISGGLGCVAGVAVIAAFIPKFATYSMGSGEDEEAVSSSSTTTAVQRRATT